MRHTRSKLFLLTGAWLSVVALATGVTTLPAPSTDTSLGSIALLYALRDKTPASFATATSSAGRAMIADLDTMQLTLYNGGELVRTYPILARGRGGTPWETPEGRYAIQTKERKHFSSIGGVWMPWSMQFYGNFFIHGWPTYPGGKEVPFGYSGGCIRLATKDAKEVYEFALVGTRINIVGGGPKSAFATSSDYFLRVGDSGTRSIESIIPPVSATAFVVSDLETGKKLWERRADLAIHPGGLSSFLAGLVALETVNQYKIVRMSELLLDRAVLRRASIGAADEMPVGTLIYPLLFDANDTAAKVFSRDLGVKQFVKYMNEKSAAIGMASSSWGGPLSGDSATTTARDLFLLVQYVDRSKQFLLDVTLAKDRKLTGKGDIERFSWVNKNPWILNGDGAYRGGLSALGARGTRNAILLFDLPVSEFGSRTVAFVLVGSTDLESDVERLRTFVGEHFVYGQTRSDTDFVREKDEPVPSILEKAQDLIDLKKFLEGDEQYEKEV